MWLNGRIPSHWYGVKGRPSSQAAWTRLAAARFAKHTSKAALATLYDVRKAYDHLDWAEIVDAAHQLEFPIVLLRFLINLYGQIRHIIIGRGIVCRATPVRSAVAGCAFADIVMFLIMKVVDAKVRSAAPLAFTAVVADDYQVMVCRHKDQAVRVAFAAHDAVKKAFRDAKLPLADSKVAFLSSDKEAGDELCAIAPCLHGRRKQVARNLGIDFTLGKVRRTAVFDARLKKVAKRFLKLRRMRNAGAPMPTYVVSCINSAQTYGGECLGAAPSQIAVRKRNAQRHIIKRRREGQPPSRWRLPMQKRLPSTLSTS